MIASFAAGGLRQPSRAALSYLLLDTDVVSYLLNRHSLASVYEDLVLGHTLFISFMTVAEMNRGALKRNWGPRRRTELRDYLRQFAVVPYTERICLAYARLCTDLENRGRTISTADALIAASALSLEIPLVTNNRRHFDRIAGLRVVSAAG